jgi:hypothetical protein
LLDIERVGNKLLISSETFLDLKEGLINLNSKDLRFFQYILNNYFRAGYDKVEIISEMSEKDVYEKLRLLAGFEISSVEDGKIVIESITQSITDKVEVLMRQLFYIVKEDFKYIISTIKNKDKIDLEKLRISGERAVRNSNLCLRMISKKVKELDGFNWMIVNLVTWIGRETYYLGKALNEGKKGAIEELSKDKIKYIEDVGKDFNHLYEGIYKKNHESFGKIHDSYSEYEKKKYSLMSDSEFSNKIIHHFNMMHRLIMRATSSGIGLMI